MDFDMQQIAEPARFFFGDFFELRQAIGVIEQEKRSELFRKFLDLFGENFNLVFLLNFFSYFGKGSSAIQQFQGGSLYVGEPEKFLGNRIFDNYSRPFS